ncbi:MAG: dTDP-4-dehydrorhamnose reductase [Chloroflexi bacterium]|nr:dTDP-4-dehydrorhamnose reductase [Chloroflexota bacterium]
MGIAVIGAAGQLGRQVPADHCLTRADLDLARPESIAPALDARGPSGVVLTAAYTDVDGCETNADYAYAVNSTGPGVVARWCESNHAWLLYVSTNCVFDGEASEPYREDAHPRPISVYGASKLAGELAVCEATDRHFIVRTSWLFGPGSANFVAKALGWAQTLPQLKGAADEIASPTYANDLAPALLDVAAAGSYGTFHLTNSGACSRFEYLVEILRIAGIEKTVEPLPMSAFSRPSRPPAYSVLANTRAAALRPWQDALREFVPLVMAAAAVGASR